MISGLTTNTKLALLGATRRDPLSSSSAAETEASAKRLDRARTILPVPRFQQSKTAFANAKAETRRMALE